MKSAGAEVNAVDQVVFPNSSWILEVGVLIEGGCRTIGGPSGQKN